jgi:hypothetical protein
LATVDVRNARREWRSARLVKSRLALTIAAGAFCEGCAVNDTAEITIALLALACAGFSYVCLLLAMELRQRGRIIQKPATPIPQAEPAEDWELEGEEWKRGRTDDE